MGCWCNHSDEEPEDADYDPQWIKEMHFLTRDPNESVFSWIDGSSKTGSTAVAAFEKGILLHVRSGQSRRYVTSAHFLSNRKLVIFIYVIISCTKVAWIKQMLHLCGLANVLPAEHRYPNQRWPSATAPNGYSSTAANCLMLATTPWLNLNKS